MGQQQSKDELLFQQVNYGNTEGIKSLRSEGAGLEWIDREGKTPLIVACMNSELYIVAKTLIELGANVNAYRPGRHAGTPLHHAAKRGLEHTVKLLLAHGANALVMNDDCQTPLDVARVKGYTNVVRAIENHICLFSGWLREFYGPGFLEILAPQLLSRKVWVVILPCGSRNLAKPLKLELAIYSNLQDAQPRSLIALWKTNMDEPNFQQADPAVIISDISNIPRRWRRKRGLSSPEARCKPERARKTRIKLASASETDRQQLQRFCNACKGIPQVVNSNFPFNNQAAILPPTAPPVTEEDPELAVAISASIQSSMETRPPFVVDANPSSGDHASSSGHGGWDTSEPAVSSKLNSSSSGVAPGGIQTLQMNNEINLPVVHPSAPPIDEVVLDDDAPVHYPSIDSSPIDLSSKEDGKKEEGDSSSCVICLDAPVEGACIPCGHMAGCMSCLNEIKSKKWGCPVCRAKIDQVVRLYAV